MGDYYWGDLYISLNFLNIYIISTIKWEAFMKKQKYKKYKQIDNLYVINNNLTKEEIIEIQSKSYYLALKQIEEEKQIEDKKNTSPNPNDNKIQYSKKIEGQYLLTAFFLPRYAFKKYALDEKMCAHSVGGFTSLILFFIGYFLRLCAIVLFIKYFHLSAFTILINLACVITTFFISSFLIFLGNRIIYEENSTEIYNFSAYVLTLLALLLNIIHKY